MSIDINMSTQPPKLHQPVLLLESLDALNIHPTGIYIDATFGRGGHSQKILEKLTTGRLICIDKDPEWPSHRLLSSSNEFPLVRISQSNCSTFHIQS